MRDSKKKAEEKMEGTAKNQVALIEKPLTPPAKAGAITPALKETGTVAVAEKAKTPAVKDSGTVVVKEAGTVAVAEKAKTPAVKDAGTVAVCESPHNPQESQENKPL